MKLTSPSAIWWPISALPTPSAAAELVSSDQLHLMERLHRLRRALVQAQRQLAAAFLPPPGLSSPQPTLAGRHPARQLQQQQQRLDDVGLLLQRPDATSSCSACKLSSNCGPAAAVGIARFAPCSSNVLSCSRCKKRCHKAIRQRLQQPSATLAAAAGTA